MYIQSSSGNRIRRNRVSRLRYGLHYMSSDGNVFEDNVFSDNVAGAAIMYSNRIELRRNAFVRNRGFSSFGLLFQDCAENIAEDNLIADNATGIFAEALRQSAFRRNTVAANDVALMIYGSSSENTFASNNFVGNLSPLQLVGRPVATRWAEGGRGNYWGDYEGYDLDADGVGDVPHRVQTVFEHMEGQRPRLRVYLGSPAAQALAAAEKTFPILRGSREAAPAPLMRAVETVPVAFERRARSASAAWVALTFAYLTTLCLSAAVMGRGRRKNSHGWTG
jgi:nitrous oxidase accessory protein